MPSSLLVRMAFGVLVLATVGAFFVVQRLKNSDPVVERVFYRLFFSPGDDGINDEVLVRFQLPERDDVTVEMVDERGDVVRTLAEDKALRKGRQEFVWEGETDAGNVAPDGLYRLRVSLRSRGRSVTVPRDLTLDTVPPAVELTKARPNVLVPDLGPRSADVEFNGPTRRNAKYTVWRTDLPGGPRRVYNFRGRAFKRTGTWNGKANGRTAPPGIYAFSLLVRDRAANLGAAPNEGPPRPNTAKAGTGVTVRYLTAAGPLEPVRAGSLARVRLGPKARRFRWSLTRVGLHSALAAGRSSGRRLILRVPRRAATGLYLVRVRSGRHAATAPLAVRGRPPRKARPAGPGGRPLVVLPAITWQGRNPSDDDFDGFADTLDDAAVVNASRAFAPNGTPPGFAREVQPLLRFLDREKAAYDLTTDLALARGRGPRLADRPGVLFAGSERWLTASLDLQLRQYVEAGGRVASFGTDAFRRRVELETKQLADPSTPEAINVFGERTGRRREAPAPMVVFRDKIGMFKGTDGFIGLFSEFEVSDGLVSGAKPLAAAGREQDHPAFLVYRLGRGLVLRAGTPEWQRAISRTDEIETVTRRTWALLSR